mgnify:CR=1 FL=1
MSVDESIERGIADAMMAQARRMERTIQARHKGSHCPICGSEIQGTWRIYRSQVSMSPDCRAVVHDGVIAMGGDPPELEDIYCENGHSQREMIEWLDEGGPIHKGERL